MPSRRDAALRHAQHYVATLAAIDALYVGGAATLDTLARLDAEWPNVRAAQASAAAWPADRDFLALRASLPDAGAYVLSLRQAPQERQRWLEGALAAAKALRDRPLQISHLLNLGLSRLDQGDLRRAATCFRRALRMARAAGRRIDEARALGNLGAVIAQLGDPREALALHAQALGIDRAENDRRGEAADLGNIGNLHARLGDHHLAIAYHRSSLQLCKSLGQTRGQGAALGAMGHAYRELGEFEIALKFLEDSLSIMRDIGDRHGEMQGLNNLANAEIDAGLHDAAERHYEQALVLARELGDRAAEANALGNLGLHHFNRHELGPALSILTECLGAHDACGDQLGGAITLFNHALVLYELDEAELAMEEATAAWRGLRKMRSPVAATVQAQLLEWRRARSRKTRRAS